MEIIRLKQALLLALAEADIPEEFDIRLQHHKRMNCIEVEFTHRSVECRTAFTQYFHAADSADPNTLSVKLRNAIENLSHQIKQ